MLRGAPKEQREAVREAMRREREVAWASAQAGKNLITNLKPAEEIKKVTA